MHADPGYLAPLPAYLLAAGNATVFNQVFTQMKAVSPDCMVQMSNLDDETYGHEAVTMPLDPNSTAPQQPAPAAAPH